MHSPTNSWAVTKRKSCTTLLCEITRLKSQQKYLESSQAKLIPEHFLEDCATSASTTASSLEANCAIKDVENFKRQLDEALLEHLQKSRATVKDICHEIKKIREDTLKVQSLEICSMDKLRKRIIGINTQIESLQTRNTNELKLLQTKFGEYDKEAVILLT
ncbi:uncharacterized protein LOC106092256 [Stomoxys calcitrans]|uniref:uncharacterized protein LOC106092256 n=1 Tax=Stomoxys calcitrans TaxID=35570 RepID=UPI0027E2A512|nr:uncharacterized protein LOC106092256 [Stomoxys calcitrans]